MIVESIVIVLPLPPAVLSPNCMIGSIGGRFMKAAAAKKYRRLTKEAIESENIESAPWEIVEVSAEFFHTTNRRRDEDNAAGSLKSAYDGIVDAGLIPDDDHKHMKRNMPSFRIDKHDPRVVITIKRLK